MRGLAGALAAALLLGAGFAAQACAPPPAAQEVREIVLRDFYDPERTAAFAEVLARTCDLDQALAALGASHTGRWTPDRIDYFEMFDTYRLGGLAQAARAAFPPDGQVTYPGVGIAPRKIDGRTFAAYVYDGSPAGQAGLKVGDEILSVDGSPYAEIGSFAGKVGKTARVEIRRSEGGRPSVLDIPVVALRPGEALREAIRASARVIEKDGRRLAYVRLWTYGGEDIGDLLADILGTPAFQAADGLVLDMRGRWGGAPPDAAEMFLGRSPSLTMLGRGGEAIGVNLRWRKPVVGVIDGGARSGMEVLAYALQRAGTPLVGTRTAGAVVAGKAYLLTTGDLLLLAAFDVRVDGVRLEGAGVAPDVEVARPLPYAAGADPQLDRAGGDSAGPPVRPSAACYRSPVI